MKISERAMIASLHTGSWSGQLVDRKVTDEVIEDHNAEQGAARVSKQIVARKFISHVGSQITAARREHNVLTLPWSDNGDRILSTMGYFAYTEAMRLRRHAVEAAATQFATAENLEQYKREAKVRLGTMYDDADYPDVEKLRKKFYLDVEIKPVPVAGDFRAELSEKAVKSIVKDLERRNDERLEAAMSDVYGRIVDVTTKMVEKLRAFVPAQGGEESKNRFRDSLVWNIKELAELIPVLNITGDDRMEKLRQQLLQSLVSYSPEELRNSERVRLRTADMAEKLAAKARQYMM